MVKFMNLRKDLTQQEDERDKISLLQPTIGWEGEVSPIRFVLLRDNKIRFVSSPTVLFIFGKTKNGVQCEQDTKIDKHFFEHIEKIAQQNHLVFSEKSHASYVFEFVTSPTDNITKLKNQFEEIEFLQRDLIQYLLKYKKENPASPLMSVRQWIDSYNKSEPGLRNPLPIVSNDVNEMFIVVDYSLKKLNEKELKDVESIQKKMMHNVQFNFIATYGRKMGSQLMTIFESNNKINAFEETLKNSEEELDQSAKAARHKMSKMEEEIYVQDLQNKIATYKALLDTKRKQKNILQHAENNAVAACHLIRTLLQDRPSHKLIKLEGFFFLLSMRILTETTFMQLSSVGNTRKNKYLFFLKAQLSELIEGLSDRDRQLLQALKGWSEENINKLLIRIAGSAEVLAISYHINGKQFTVRQVIESALGWSQDKICNLFPNGPVIDDTVSPFLFIKLKQVEPAYEPKTVGMRSKPHQTQFRRCVLEYRGSSNKTLVESEKIMQDMLSTSAKLCETTALHKKWGMDLEETKQTDFIDEIENNSQKAIACIQAVKAIKINFKKLLYPLLMSDDREVALKQLNHLFIKIQTDNLGFNGEAKNFYRIFCRKCFLKK